MDHSQNVLGTPTNTMSKTNPKVGSYLNKGRKHDTYQVPLSCHSSNSPVRENCSLLVKRMKSLAWIEACYTVGQVNNMTKRPPFREAESPLEGRLTINWNNPFFHEMIILPKGALSAAPRSHYEVQLGP